MRKLQNFPVVLFFSNHLFIKDKNNIKLLLVGENIHREKKWSQQIRRVFLRFNYFRWPTCICFKIMYCLLFLRKKGFWPSANINLLQVWWLKTYLRSDQSTNSVVFCGTKWQMATTCMYQSNVKCTMEDWKSLLTAYSNIRLTEIYDKVTFDA